VKADPAIPLVYYSNKAFAQAKKACIHAKNQPVNLLVYQFGRLKFRSYFYCAGKRSNPEIKLSFSRSRQKSAAFYHKSTYMKQLLFAATITLSILSINVNAQTKKVNIAGKIISFEESFPLEGATVQVKGTKNVTGTQADGTFNLSVDAGDKFLVIKLNGYESQEVELTRSREYSVTLKRANLLSAREINHRNLTFPIANTISLN
jgi:hypothetical protein